MTDFLLHMFTSSSPVSRREKMFKVSLLLRCSIDGEIFAARTGYHVRNNSTNVTEVKLLWPPLV